MKLLKRKMLFVLASELDFFKLNEGFNYYSYSFLYPRLLNYQTSSVRDAVLQLVKKGMVDKIIRNHVPLFRLTSRGREKLLSFFPINIGQKKVWDRVWRLAIINLEKETKNKGKARKDLRKLRKLLRDLGFKKFSRSVYITPLPVSQELKTLLLEEDFSANIAVIESRKLLLGDDQQLAKQIWPLDDLLKDYQNLINQMKILLKRIKGKKSLKYEEKKPFFPILDFYFSLLEKDPGLPKKLLSSDWLGETAKEIFLRLVLEIKSKENRT